MATATRIIGCSAAYRGLGVPTLYRKQWYVKLSSTDAPNQRRSSKLWRWKFNDRVGPFWISMAGPGGTAGRLPVCMPMERSETRRVGAGARGPHIYRISADRSNKHDNSDISRIRNFLAQTNFRFGFSPLKCIQKHTSEVFPTTF